MHTRVHVGDDPFKKLFLSSYPWGKIELRVCSKRQREGTELICAREMWNRDLQTSKKLKSTKRLSPGSAQPNPPASARVTREGEGRSSGSIENPIRFFVLLSKSTQPLSFHHRSGQLDMAGLVPPVVRDGFVYNGVLFVEASGLNRHPRAAISELTDLLRPALGQQVPTKDQVAHFYEAQLIHYGLPRVKEKNAAKVRLLNAINAGSLQVPASIMSLESSMKKEYDNAVRKARASEKQKEKPAKKPSTAAAKKTATKDVASLIQQNVTHITSITYNINSKEETSKKTGPAKTTATTKKKPAPKSATKDDAKKKTPAPKSAAKDAAKKKTPASKAKASSAKSPASRVNDKGAIQKTSGPSASAKKPLKQTAKSADLNGNYQHLVEAQQAYTKELVEAAKKQSTGKGNGMVNGQGVPKKPSTAKPTAIKRETGVKKKPVIKKEVVKKEPAVKKEVVKKIKSEPFVKNEPGPEENPHGLWNARDADGDVIMY